MTRQSSKQQQTLVLSAMALAISMVAGHARADTPLSLAVSESLTYDSNLLRNDKDKYGDTSSATGVQVGFDKAYGRQTYKASATAVATRYKKSKEYDNDGYNLSLGFTSYIASNWYVMLDHNRVSQLQSFQDQGLIRIKDTIDSQETQLFAQYGLFSRWSLNATANWNKSDYDVQNYYDRNSDAAKLGVRYSPTDLLYFDVGFRRTNSEMPNYPVSSFSGGSLSQKTGDTVKRSDLEFSSRWVVTGYSSLNARLAWTKEKHEQDTLRDFNGITGRFAWNYTPTGKTSYSVSLDRDTNNAGGSTSLGISLSGLTPVINYGLNSQKRVSTGLTLSTTYNATSKISLTATGSYRRIQEEEDTVFGQLSGESAEEQSSGNRLSGNYRSINLGVNYQILRSTQLGCSVEKYARSASLFGQAFHGDSVSCRASFSID